MSEEKKRTSQAQLDANKRHLAKLEDIKIRVEKDSEKNREYYKKAASDRGYSLNQFVIDAMDEKIEREPIKED